jgi:threonine aldolase
MIERLADDHANARRLAEALVTIPGVTGLDPVRVRTNFVLFRVPDRESFLEALAADGVLMVPYPYGQIRAVTHYGIEAADIDRVVIAVRRALADGGSARDAMAEVASVG